MTPGRMTGVAVFSLVIVCLTFSVNAEIVRVYEGEHGRAEYEITDEGLKVLHLRGTPYQMGYQHGWLLHEEVMYDINSTRAYLQSKPWDEGVGTLWDKADHVLSFCRSYIPAQFMEEIKGLIDGVRARDPGAAIDETLILKLHVATEVLGTSFLCTQFAAFKSMTKDGHVIHARNLEWSPSMGCQANGMIIIYDGTEGYAFANFTWAGFIGGYTGVNQKGLMCGLNSSPCSDETFSGLPMCFQVRQVLEKSGSVEEARKTLSLMRRTLGTNFIVSTGRDPKIIRAFESSATRLVSFTDNDPAEDYYVVSPGYTILVQPPGMGVAIPIDTSDPAWGLKEFQFAKPIKDAVIRTNNYCDHRSLPEPMLKLQVQYFWDAMRDNILNHDSYPNPYPGPGIELFYAMTYKAPDYGVESPNTTVRRYFDVRNLLSAHVDMGDLDIDGGVNILKAVGHSWTLQSIVIDTTTLQLKMADAVGNTPAHKTTYRFYDLSKVFPAKIELQSPKPPASFPLWAPVSFQWAVTGDAGELVNVEFSTDGGQTWAVLDAPRGARLPARRGHARLRLGQEAEGAEVFFRVVSTSVPAVFGVQGPFRVGNPPALVSGMKSSQADIPADVAEPEGGGSFQIEWTQDSDATETGNQTAQSRQSAPEKIERQSFSATAAEEPFRIIEPSPLLPVSWGGAQIRWEGGKTERAVNILWRENPSAPWQIVAHGIPNTGQCSWDVPRRITSQGEIAIESARNRQRRAAVRPLTLTPLKVVAPNEAKTMRGGSTVRVQWTTPKEFGPVDVHLVEASAPQRVLRILGTNITGQDAILWRVPDNLVVKARVRVRLSRRPEIFDLSDAAFYILPATARQMTPPAEGNFRNP